MYILRPIKFVARRRARACALRNHVLIPTSHYIGQPMRVSTKIVFYPHRANARAHGAYYLFRTQYNTTQLRNLGMIIVLPRLVQPNWSLHTPTGGPVQRRSATAREGLALHLGTVP